MLHMEVYIVCGASVAIYLGLLHSSRQRNIVNQEKMDAKPQICREAW